jgi:hypothetical protein
MKKQYHINYAIVWHWKVPNHWSDINCKIFPKSLKTQSSHCLCPPPINAKCYDNICWAPIFFLPLSLLTIHLPLSALSPTCASTCIYLVRVTLRSILPILRISLSYLATYSLVYIPFSLALCPYRSLVSWSVHATLDYKSHSTTACIL